MAGDGDDRIFGGAGADSIDGGAGNDDLYGNDGDDIIRSGTGDNRVDGGDGSDTLYLDGTQSQYSISTNDGEFSASSSSYGSVSAINVEKIVFTGDGSELLIDTAEDVDSNATADTTNTFSTDSETSDSLSAEVSVNTTSQYWYPGAASDYTFIDNGDGSISVIDGLDRTSTLSSSDSIWFDAENTAYTASDLVAQEEPTSQIVASSAGGYRVGTNGDDEFVGGDGVDVFDGLSGADSFDGGGGDYNQVNYGGAASDYSFSANDDGSVSVTDGAGETDVLTGIDGLWFEGEQAWYSVDSLITEQNNASVIYAGDQGGYFVGTQGDDRFVGGDGVDVFDGVTGADVFDGAGGEYNQVNYAGAASDYNFLRKGRWQLIGWLMVTAIADTLTNIDGLWFEAEQGLVYPRTTWLAKRTARWRVLVGPRQGAIMWEKLSA